MILMCVWKWKQNMCVGMSVLLSFVSYFCLKRVSRTSSIAVVAVLLKKVVYNVKYPLKHARLVTPFFYNNIKTGVRLMKKIKPYYY